MSRRSTDPVKPDPAPAGGRLPLSGMALTAFIVVAHGVNDVFTSVLPALLPSVQARFGLGEATLALLVATFTFSSSLPQPLLGALSERLSPRAATALGIGLSAIVLSLIGIVPSTPLLFLLILIGGLGSAALHPAGSLIARAADESRADRAAALFTAGGMVGFALGPVAILALVSRFGFGSTLWLMVPGLALALATLILVPASTQRREGRTPFDRQLLVGPVGWLTLAATLSHLPFLTFLSAAPLWLVSERGFSPDASLIGWTLATFSLACAAGSAAGGWLGERWGRAAVAAGSMILSIAPFIALLTLEAGSLAYFGAVAAAGFFAYMSLPLLVVSAQDLAPKAVAAASGMLIGLSAGLAGLLYVGIGWLQETIGIGNAMAASYLAMLPAAALAFVVLRRHAASFVARSNAPSLQLPCGCRSGPAIVG